MALDMTRQVQWERATQRALAAGLPARLRRTTQGDSILVPSRTEAGRVYHVQLSGGRVGYCDCPAGLNHRPCAHRAAVALRIAEREAGNVRLVALRPAAVVGLQRYLREC